MPFIGSQPAETALTTGNLADDIVTEAKMANDAIGLAELKAGTDGEIISWDASGNPVAIGAGSSGEFLKSQGAGSVPVFAAAGGLTLATEQATTSGTTFTFSSIPSGTTMIVMMFGGVSSDGTDFSVTIGDSGGLETSGYTSGANWVQAGDQNAITSTSAFIIDSLGSGTVLNGSLILTLKDSSNFDWVASHSLGDSSGNTAALSGGGHKSLSAELTQISLAGGTFDAGAVNIAYM